MTTQGWRCGLRRSAGTIGKTFSALIDDGSAAATRQQNGAIYLIYTAPSGTVERRRLFGKNIRALGMRRSEAH